MNAAFNQISPADAAKMLGCNRTAVTNWCKRGLINFIDVSESNSTVPRYVLTEEEVDRIRRARKRFGPKWIQHYKKDKPTKKKKSQVKDDSYIFENIESFDATTTNAKRTEPSDSSDSEKILKTIMYIKDIKERLEDLEAEKAQMLNELEELRNEINAYI